MLGGVTTSPGKEASGARPHPPTPSKPASNKNVNQRNINSLSQSVEPLSGRTLQCLTAPRFGNSRDDRFAEFWQFRLQDRIHKKNWEEDPDFQRGFSALSANPRGARLRA